MLDGSWRPYRPTTKKLPGAFACTKCGATCPTFPGRVGWRFRVIPPGTKGRPPGNMTESLCPSCVQAVA